MESAQRDTLKLLKAFIFQNLKVKPMKFATFAFDPSPSSVMFSFCTVIITFTEQKLSLLSDIGEMLDLGHHPKTTSISV